MNEQSLLYIIKYAAMQAGAEVLEIRNSGKLGAEEKIDGSILTKADQRSQEIIVRNLADLPLTYIAEEKGSELIAKLNEKNKSAVYQAVIDPIDGTRPFKAGTDDFCISIGITKKQRPVAGVVYAPAQKKLFFACKNQGAFLMIDDTETFRIHTSPNKDFDKFKLAMNPRELLKGSYNDYFQNLGYAQIDLEKVKQGDITPPEDRLIFGYSTTLVFANVANGAADYAMTFVLAHPPEPDGTPGKKGGRPVYDWDLAAVDLIIEEAGGCVTDFEGNKILYGQHKDAFLKKHAIATNSPETHAKLLLELQKKIDHDKIYSFFLK